MTDKLDQENPQNWIQLMSLMCCMAVLYERHEIENNRYEDAANKVKEELAKRFGSAVATQVADQSWEEGKARAAKFPYSSMTREDLLMETA